MNASLKVSLMLVLVVAVTAGSSIATADQKRGSRRANVTRSANRRQASQLGRGNNSRAATQRRATFNRGIAPRNLTARTQTQQTHRNFAPSVKKNAPRTSPSHRGNFRNTLHAQNQHLKKGTTSGQNFGFRNKHGRPSNAAHRNLDNNKLREVFTQRATIGKTAGYRRALTHAHGHHWQRRAHCGWWSDFALSSYYHNHRRYCPDTYWNQCYRYRYVVIACPATSVYAPSHWYFGCDVVYIPETGYGIESVTPNSPAALAGLKQGDMILQVNGQTPLQNEALGSAVQATGGLLGLGVLREGSQELENVQVALQRIQKSSF